jgi:hypothetical protein
MHCGEGMLRRHAAGCGLRGAGARVAGNLKAWVLSAACAFQRAAPLIFAEILQVSSAFKIERHTERKDDFETHKDLKERKLLWHGWQHNYSDG